MVVSLRQEPASAARPEEDLVSLVTSRICHDLVSPIGAIDNGVELMAAISGGSHSAEMGLIGESARAANLKLRMFRIAFGAAPEDATTRGADLRAVFDGAFNRARLSFEWADAPDALPRAMAKLSALALLCAEGAMAYGGRLTLHGAGRDLRVVMAAERYRWQDGLWDALAGRGDFASVTAGEVQFPLARLQAEDMGLRFTLDRQPGEAVLRAG